MNWQNKGLMAEILEPGRKTLRKMGYLKDQAGILKRYFREEGNWHNHIDNCHEFILNELKSAKPEKVLVLGSGWLLDFPIDNQDIRNIDITLADISHPRQIVHKVKNLSSVQLLNIDITAGLIERVFSLVDEGQKSGSKPDITNLDIPPISFTENYEYVISLNILNQLDTLLVDYMEKFWNFSEEEILTFRKQIQQSHLSIFQSTKGILISDMVELQKDKKGTVINEKKLIFADLPASKNRKSWEWNFDTHYAYNDNHLVDMVVEAISF